MKSKAYPLLTRYYILKNNQLIISILNFCIVTAKRLWIPRRIKRAIEQTFYCRDRPFFGTTACTGSFLYGQKIQSCS